MQHYFGMRPGMWDWLPHDVRVRILKLKLRADMIEARRKKAATIVFICVHKKYKNTRARAGLAPASLAHGVTQLDNETK